jgi:hypothetical protein
VVGNRIGGSEKSFQEAAMPAAFPYPVEVEQSMKVMYRALREHDRRLYAAVEAAKLGHGGTDYIAGLLECDPKTIRRGQDDLEHLRSRPLQDIGPRGRVRKKGGAQSPW